MSDSQVDLLNQVFYIQGPDNSAVAVSAAAVDEARTVAVVTTLNYAVQIGASIMMLVTVLTMSGRRRLQRASTIINMLGLVVTIVRMLLSTLFFTSTYFAFYRVFSGDFSSTTANDLRVSCAATFLALPQTVLINAALFIQAYSMMKMWPTAWRAAALLVSSVIVVFAIGFKIAFVIVRIERTINQALLVHALWVYRADIAFTYASIFWFCLVFLARIVAHMVEYRSVLPPISTVSALEVLAMTNGLLMIVPAVFAAIDLSGETVFGAGSVTTTSVVLVLPLAALIARRVSRNHALGSSAGVSRSGASGPGGSLPGPDAYRSSRTASTAGHHGAFRRATADAGGSKRHLFSTCSEASDATVAPMFSGTASTHVRIQGGGRHATRLGSIDTYADSDSFAKGKPAPFDPIDHELNLIDAGSPDNRVWVGREVEVRKESA